MRVDNVIGERGMGTMARDLELTTTQETDHLVVALAGELDLAGRDQFIDTVSPYVREGTAVVVDLTLLVFIDSTGLGALIACRNLAGELSVGFSVRNARNQVAEILALTGLDRALTAADQ